MKDTSGQSGSSLSKPLDLQSFLENKLRQTLGATGCLEYDLTWKHWGMKSGREIFALRASVRHTHDKDYTGWPTPNTMDHMNRKGLRPSRVATGRTGGYITEILSQLKPEAHGENQEPSNSLTAKKDALDPELVRWLMGFPPEWSLSKGTETQSSLHLQQNS